jgi:two-component system nitrogen regulation response regulator NtrX
MKKILIIDDEKEVCIALKGILSDEGYKVITSLDPKNTLSLIRAESPDLILLDVWFRKKSQSGLSTLQDIRRQRPFLPVIMISGHAASDIYKKVIHSGANAVLEKPVNINNLIFEINRCIEMQYLRSLHNTCHHQYAWPFALDKDVQEQALSDQHILLMGHDTVAMKRLAYAVHQYSHRCDHPVRWISAHQMNQMNDEALWGVEDNGILEKPGLFDGLYGGTIILQDLDHLQERKQKAILQMIKKKSFTRLDAQGPIFCNLRIIATTSSEHTRQKISSALLGFFALPFIAVPDICTHSQNFKKWVHTLCQEMLDKQGVSVPHMTDETIEKIRNSPYGSTLNALEYALHTLCDDSSLSLFIRRSLLSSDHHFVLPTDAFTQPWPQAKHLFEEAYLDFHMKRRTTVSAMAKDLQINRTALYRKMKHLGKKKQADL